MQITKDLHLKSTVFCNF